MVQSLERAFAILDAVAARPGGVTELADSVGLPKSTVARLLSTLAAVGAVERGDGARWQLGPAVARLARAGSPEDVLRAAARPGLGRLVQLLDEDAGLAVPDGYDVLYVDQVSSGNAVQVRDWTGVRAPMHTVPSGLVLLADRGEDAVEAYLARPLAQRTQRTVTDPGALRDRLAAVRAAGLAWGREEYAEGINSVAAPVRDRHGKAVAAVHVHGPAYRFPADGGEGAAEAVVAAALAVGRRLGGE